MQTEVGSDSGGRFMSTEADHVVGLIFGRWRSQIVHAGVILGVFDKLAEKSSKRANDLAAELRTDSALLYRLLRALASLGLLNEDDSKGFTITEAGTLLREDHQQSLKYVTLLEEGPEHYAVWKHLPAMIRDGKQDGFLREYGITAFDYADRHSQYDQIFNRAMTSFSARQADLALEALRNYDFSDVKTLCDIAGGYGYLACRFLQARPHLAGVVFDQPAVVGQKDQLWAPKFGVGDRCRYVGGDMFREVPAADAFLLKNILHDWNDDECANILANMRKAASGQGRVFVIEHVIPPPTGPHFANLFDIHMMCWGSGRERTEREHAQLMDRSGWKFIAAHYPENKLIGVIEGRVDA